MFFPTLMWSSVMFGVVGGVTWVPDRDTNGSGLASLGAESSATASSKASGSGTVRPYDPVRDKDNKK